MQGGEFGLGLGFGSRGARILAKLMEPWITLRCRDALRGCIYHYSPSLFSAAFFSPSLWELTKVRLSSLEPLIYMQMVWVRSFPEGWEPICPLLNTQIHEQSHCKAALPTHAETTRPSGRSCCTQPLSAAFSSSLQYVEKPHAGIW